jgi:BirA family transcriptional regulator, biotin operon repressor / biotin---[acetyl-CoA-carboxylase] ligase
VNWDVRRFETIDSTNQYLLEQAADGAPQGLVAVARHQTSGRGRRGRVWDSKPGASLCISALFRPSSGENLVLYPQAIGLAVVDAAALTVGATVQLKWPNDVVVSTEAGPKKLAGVLAESVTDGQTALVVGCGINLNWQGDMSPALSETAISLDDLCGHAVDESQFLNAFLESLSQRLSRPTWIANAYRQRCITLGADVRVEQADAIVVGRADSVTDEGALVVKRSDGEMVEVTIGDVVHVR